ncbi:MAG TPA: Ger(x)C family spore germination protein [Candidatus Deferrimicrobium sp.]|nr:Ger(x)C family spore germination protein [Candidatus Deferrimicrobium sp.]
MKRHVVALIFLLLILTTGCYGKTEIDQLAMVMSIGFDKGTDGDYLISFKIAKPTSKGVDKSKSYLLFTFNSKATSEAADQLYKVMDKAPFFGQTRLIIISEELAREGITPIMDYVTRHYHLRRNVKLLISKDKVSNILDVPFSGEDYDALNLTSRIRNLNKDTQNETITIGNFSSKLAVGKIQPVIPGEEILSNNDTNVKFSEKQKEIAIQDLGVFKGDHLIGWLNSDETAGYMYTTGKARISKILVPLEENQHITLMFSKYKISKKIEEAEDGLPVIKLSLTADAYLEEAKASVTPKTWLDFTLLGEKAAEKTVQELIENAINKSKGYNADIFGFGQLIFRERPDLWRTLEPQWDEIFPNLKVVVEANVTIKRSGATTSPPFESKEERNTPIIE